MNITSLTLEILIIIVTIGIYSYLKNYEKKAKQKFIILFIAVFLFEIMSEPMWINHLFNSWAYLYGNVSWIVTLGWVDIFFVSFIIVDKLIFKNKKLSEKIKFWLYLLIVTIITVPLEAMLLKYGFRSYSSALTDTFSGLLIPFTGVPIELLIAVPMIAALIIPFYKYVNSIE
jgi:hypothetical protein